MTTMQGSGIRTFFLLIRDRGSEVTASEFILLCWLRGYSRECGASLLPAVGQQLRFALAPFVGMVISVVFAPLTTTRRIGGRLAKSCLPLSHWDSSETARMLVRLLYLLTLRRWRGFVL